MSLSKSQAVATRDLPKVVRAYIDATNRFDLDGLVASFADDALVNDQQREYRGPEAIRAWAAHGPRMRS